MKAGILYNDFDIKIGDAREPEIMPDEVLIESYFGGICGTDLHIYKGEFKERVKYPAILGHEFGGIIREIGKNVSGFTIGQAVVVDPVISCHNCPACFTGHINACKKLKLLGVELNGGFGRYVAAKANQVYQMPDGIDMMYFPMVEMYALANHILNRGRVQLGESIAIFGAGKLGLSILDLLCHNTHANLTIVTDTHPFRLDIAKKLGADYAIDVKKQDPVEQIMEITKGTGVDCVIEAVGHYHIVNGQEAPLAQAVKAIRNGGRIVTAGLGEQLSNVHFKTLVIKEAEIIATRVTRGEFPQAIRILSKGLLHPELLITHKMALKDITKAFSMVEKEEPSTIKVVLDIQKV